MEENELTPLEKREREKSIIRHDLKGSLNRIYALSRLITMAGPELSEEQKEYLKKIEAECKTGTERINKAIPKGESEGY
jgi:signal transduction histidine kinase